MRIYTDMVADLFHHGHISILKEMKNLDGQDNCVIVGIHSDKDVESYKRLPVMTMEERIKCVEGCKFVDYIIPNAPLRVTSPYLDSLNVDIIVHGDNISDNQRNYFYGHVIDRYRELKYTDTISSLILINRIRDNCNTCRQIKSNGIGYDEVDEIKEGL
jgi:cytidyltransferase-like protein